jgi:hypothetical protein
LLHSGRLRHQTQLERPAREKRSNLLQTFVNYGRKKFYYIWLRRRGFCLKTKTNRFKFKKLFSSLPTLWASKLGCFTLVQYLRVGSYLPYNIRLGCKGLPGTKTIYLSLSLKIGFPGTNTLAYFVRNVSQKKKKVFLTLVLGRLRDCCGTNCQVAELR